MFPSALHAAGSPSHACLMLCVRKLWYGRQGRVVNFKNTLIIMTSNVGSSVIEKGGGRIGFQLEMQTEEDSSYNRIKNLVNEELKQYFRSAVCAVCMCVCQTCSAFALGTAHTEGVCNFKSRAADAAPHLYARRAGITLVRCCVLPAHQRSAT